jgi:hypothetical protein
VKLSLERIFRALASLNHPRAIQIVADLALEKKSRWRHATENRNASILAHGVKPIGKEGFEEMLQLAAGFMGFDLERESNPIPPLDARWF